IAVLVIVVLGVVGVVVLGGGGSGSSSKSTSGKSPSPGPASELAASPPTLDNQPLEFTMSTTSASSSAPSTYVVVLRPGTVPTQFVESEVYPTTNSRQLTTETFSSRGVEVSAVTSSSPTGSSSSNFTPPLLLLSAPYRAGNEWTSTATSSSATGQTT